LKVPVGTVIGVKGGEPAAHEVTKIGERICIAKGGRGGRGNFHFRSAINTSPKEFEEGRPGEAFEIHFELKLIADVGFIGLPNVGKSSMLNELTNADAKVANYRFTTLEPNLGVFYDLILADIPGLIEGASEGKGLGIRFLKHIERTKILFHFVSAESEDPSADYRTVRDELGKFDPRLLEKQEFVFLSKSDEVPEMVREERRIALEKEAKKDVFPVSILDDRMVRIVKNTLSGIAQEKQVSSKGVSI